MTDEQYEAWLATLTVVGDEAYLPGERPVRRWHRLSADERIHYERDRMRRRRQDPAFRAREKARRQARALRRTPTWCTLTQ